MENVRLSKNSYRLDGELKNVPVAFVNGLRRILLSEIPVVAVSNIQILTNSSSMTHEMIHQRVSMLPIAVKAEEVSVIRDTKLELRITVTQDTPLDVTTDDFVAAGPRGNILLRDRDLNTPMFFLRLKPGEQLHIRANLSIVPTGMSQVCVSTFKNHIDPDIATVDRDTFVARAGEDPAARLEAARVFDAFHIQRSFSRNKETHRPDWFDFAVESIGVYTAPELLKKACEIYLGKVTEWAKTPILRESDGWYRMETEGESFTLGQLLQEVIYLGGLVEYVSRDIGHPLTPKLVLRFKTKTVQPEAVVERFKAEASALCENVLKSV